MTSELLQPGPLVALDYVGITVFAVSGALAAAPVAGILGFGLRGTAIVRGLSLPSYKGYP